MHPPSSIAGTLGEAEAELLRSDDSSSSSPSAATARSWISGGSRMETSAASRTADRSGPSSPTTASARRPRSPNTPGCSSPRRHATCPIDQPARRRASSIRSFAPTSVPDPPPEARTHRVLRGCLPDPSACRHAHVAPRVARRVAALTAFTGAPAIAASARFSKSARSGSSSSAVRWSGRIPRSARLASASSWYSRRCSALAPGKTCRSSPGQKYKPSPDVDVARVPWRPANDEVSSRTMLSLRFG